jgi:antitoxin VapB
MEEARLFTNGQSQAVRLPKAFRFKGKSVFIRRLGNAIILLPRKDPWSSLINACRRFDEEILPKRDQGTQHRDKPFL